MIRKSVFRHRVFLFLATLMVVGMAIYGLTLVNERMTVRYQAVGMVIDAAGAPMKDVEAILLLEPPPPDGPQLDALFKSDGEINHRHGMNGKLQRAIGPAIGLSTNEGLYVVRTMGRLGSTHAIRLGFDQSGRPPFETAWLVLRKEGYPLATRTISILGWRTAPRQWGTFANRLPRISLGKGGAP